MSNAEKIGAYVIDAAALDIVIHIENAGMRSALLKLGFIPGDADTIKLTTSGIEEKAKILRLLRDMGIAFSVGPGWSPSDVFEEFRDRKLINGVYKRISWLGPGNWRIEADC